MKPLEPRKRWKIACFVLPCLFAAAAQATTLLTSGEPVTFGGPPVTRPTMFAGEFGYAIYAPPGATRLTIRYVNLTVAIDMDALVRFGADVGFTGVGTTVQDYVVPTLEANVKELVITPQSSPPLQSGLYYIGFLLRSATMLWDGSILATVEGGSNGPFHAIAVSTFDTDLDGWIRNPSGDADSELRWFSSGGNPGGYLRFLEPGGSNFDSLIAPPRFGGNWLAQKAQRIEFDLKQISGFQTDLPVEARISGAGTVFSWQGPLSSPPPDAPPFPPAPTFPPLGDPPNPPVTPPSNRWQRYVAALDRAQWTRLSGEAAFRTVLANVQQVEVITDLSRYGESQAIDNFALIAEGDGPPPTVLAGNTGFASGADGWSRNYPATDLPGGTTGDSSSNFRWVAFEGNPNGYIRLNDAGGLNRDYLVGPARFLGDYRQIRNPQMEFDYLHTSLRGATLPVEVRLAGADSVFAWTGAIPDRLWTHYAVPLNEAFWRRVSGTAAFAAVLADVRRIEISMDQAEGPESNGLDNFWILTASAQPAPPAMSANPLSLSFSGVARGADPAPQLIAVTSMGGGPAVSFRASTSGGGSWLKVSAPGGTTPRTLNVWPDLAGLTEGTYTGRVIVTPLSEGLEPRVVGVTLTVAARPGGLPRIARGGIVNSAGGRSELAPGGLGSLYGENLGPRAGVASFVPGSSALPTRLEGVRLLVRETTGGLLGEAPLLYVSPSQINFQLPFEALGRSEVLLVVERDGVPGDGVPVAVAPTSPGIFTYAENRAVAVNQDTTINSETNPAGRGTALTVYMTGQGVVTPAIPTGSAATARPLVRCPHPAQAWIGGAPAQILFLGLTPGLVGVLQLNLVVPEGAPSGDSPLLVHIDGRAGNRALVTIR